MLLQRCTKMRAPIVVAAMASLLLAGCGGGATVKSASDEPEAVAAGKVSRPAAIPTNIPPAALTMFEQATAVMAGGDMIDAELRFKEFALQYPEYPGAFVNLAIIHAASDDDAAARAAIDAALAIEPSYPAALNQLGMLLRRNGNFLEAETAYLKAVTVSPQYALAHYNLGVLNELYLQRLDAALRHFETYQSLVGEDKQVAKWITDLTRRVAASQRTANVAD